MNKRNEKVIKGRKCYDHLGGKLGNLVFEKFIELEWIKPEEGKSTVYEITEKGSQELAKIGIKLD